MHDDFFIATTHVMCTQHFVLSRLCFLLTNCILGFVESVEHHLKESLRALSVCSPYIAHFSDKETEAESAWQLPT